MTNFNFKIKEAVPNKKKTHLQEMVAKFGRPSLILKQICHQNICQLKEELGVEDNIANYANRFARQLINLYYSRKITNNMIEYDKFGRPYVEIEGDFHLFNMDSHLNFCIVNFNDYRDLMANAGEYNIGASFDPNNSSYEIVCPAIQWQLDDSFLQPVLHHEMVHNYQLTKMARNDLFVTKDRLRYNKAHEERVKDNEFVNACSEIIYLSNKVEISAYANQLYSELLLNRAFITANDERRIEIALQGEVGTVLHYFQYCLRIVQEIQNRADANEYCFKTYGMPLKSLIRKGEKYYRYFQKRIGKVIVKLSKDLERQ